MMSASTVILVLGGLLILAAVLGGGFEIKEIKIPLIGGGRRLLAGATGAALLVLGLGMSGSAPQTDNAPTRPNGSAPGATLVTFTIRDSLGTGQVSEQVRVLIDGKEAGTLTVNEHYPLSTINVTVPKEGQYSYVLEARAVFRDEQSGELREIVGAGQGAVNVSAGKKFELSSTITGDTWLAHIEEVRQ